MKPYFVPWSGNLLRHAAAIIVDAGEDPLFPITTVIDGNPAWPAKNAGNTIRIRIQLTTPSPASCAAWIHHTLGDTTELRVQANTTNSWGAPPLDVVFPARVPEGGEYRQNAIVRFPEASYLWWSFTVPAPNAVDIWIGQIWLGLAIDFHDDFRYQGNAEDETASVIEHLTYAEVSLRLKKGFVRRMVEGVVRGDHAEVARYSQLFHTLTGSAEPLLVVGDPRHPSALMAILDTPTLRRTLADIEAYDLQLRFRELSRGLAFPRVLP